MYDDVDDTLHHWKQLFISVCDKHCPVVSRRVRKSFLPWIDSDIKEEIRLKYYYQHKAKTKKSSDILLFIQALQKLCVKYA